MDDCSDCFGCSLPCFPGKKSDEPKTVNIFLGFFFMLNLVVGIGFLGLPFSFVSGGILPGIITIAVAAFVSWNCAIWELEVMARAQVCCIITRCTMIVGGKYMGGSSRNTWVVAQGFVYIMFVSLFLGLH